MTPKPNVVSSKSMEQIAFEGDHVGTLTKKEDKYSLKRVNVARVVSY